jgi:hypothetical protein
MNPIILAIAAVWFIHLNNYFGWNRKPQSGTELIADGLFLLILALAFLVRRA